MIALLNILDYIITIRVLKYSKGKNKEKYIYSINNKK